MNKIGNPIHNHRGSGGRGRSPTYVSWQNMKQRCGKPGTVYAGLKFDQRWRNFEAFLDDMGERPSLGHELDRIDPEDGYHAQNCRWLPREENRRRANARRWG